MNNNYNYSSKFLLPFLRPNYGMLFNAFNLKNCYIGDERFVPKEKNRLYLLFHPKPNDLNEFKKILQNKGIPNMEFYYPTNNILEYVVVCNFPKDCFYYLKEFIQGRYSKIKQTDINKYFPRMVRNVYGDSIISPTWEILVKSKRLKKQLEQDLEVEIDDEQELFSIPYNNREIIEQSKTKLFNYVE